MIDHDPGCDTLELSPTLGPSTKPCNCMVSLKRECDEAIAALVAAMPLVPEAKANDRTLSDLVALLIDDRDRWARRYSDAIHAANYERHELDRAFQVAAPDWETVRPPEGTTLRAFLIARLMAERDELRAKLQDALVVIRAVVRGKAHNPPGAVQELITGRSMTCALTRDEDAAYERIRHDVDARP